MTLSDIEAKIKQYEARLAEYVCNTAELQPDLVFRLRRDIAELTQMYAKKAGLSDHNEAQQEEGRRPTA